jgi:ABC-type sulfate transport system permease component
MSQTFARVVFGFTAVFFAAFFIWPIYQILRGGFIDADGRLTFAYLATILSDPTYLGGLKNSFFLACAATTFAMAIALPLAFISDRFLFPGKTLLSSLVLIPMILPPFVGAIGIKQIFGQYGALNALLIELNLRPPGWTFDWFAANQFWGIAIVEALTLYPIIYLNAVAARNFRESQIFRIDHYLGKETVQNLLALRFANIMFEPLWNAAHIDHVQITVAETVGLEGRVAFYDDAGAIRDMVQNHMLQLLALVAMEPPAHFDATAVRDEKVKVLRALRRVGSNETVTGQYRAGAIGGQAVPGYDEELGKPSDTETFVAIKAHVDNWRWKGVPFYLRTGKRMPKRVTEIVIQFRCVPHSIFAGKGATMQPNRLVIGIQPEENITLSLMAKVPGLDREGIRLRSVPLNIAMPDAFSGAVRRIAYERLLLDLVEGDQTLFVRRDEVEAQWDWVDAIRAGWAADGLTPKTYTAGSWGPSAAIALAERDGVTWHE